MVYSKEQTVDLLNAEYENIKALKKEIEELVATREKLIKENAWLQRCVDDCECE